MSKYTIGIDVGGTNLKFGVINSTGKIVSRFRLDTKRYLRSKVKLIDALSQSVLDVIAEKNIKTKDVLGIGVGLPGLINSKAGIVNLLPNIPGWKNVPFKTILQKKLKIPTFIENDVNLITLGEWKYGAGRGVKNLICMTLGTGVGAGLILNNEIYQGEGFVAGELGHMPINERGPDCPCGGSGCLERYVGNKYLMEKAGKIFKNKNIRLEDVHDLASKGNIRAVQFWEETATHIGNGLVGVINLLNPRLVIIGGGVSNNYKYMSKTINKIVQKRAMKVQAKMVKVTRAKLGDDAGIIGAQVLVAKNIK